jgi:uncharacterized membrane protein
MVKFVAILLIALVFEAVGVVFLSRGLKEIPSMKEVSVMEVVHVVKNGACNGRIWLGMLFESMFFFALLYMLSQRDVSLVWPLTSLGFVITTLAARLYLHEEVSFIRWAGVALIVLGAGLGIYSEKMKEKQSANQPETAAATEIADQKPAL